MAKMTISSNKSEAPKKEDIGGDCVNEIRQAITDAKIGASGRTAASLNYKDDWDSLTIYGDRSGAPISTLQHGRPAGKIPLGFIGIIKQWILVKGITVRQVPYLTDRPHKYTVEERSLNMASGAIANFIKQNGTQRNKEPRNDIYTPALEKAVERFKQRAAAYMKYVIINTLMK